MSHATFPDLKGASVVITGGGSGIGAALTEAFLRQGAKVAFCQRSDASAFCDDMEKETGNRPLFLPCDLTDLGQLKDVLSQAAEAHGTITVLVNNAANDKRHTTMEVDADFYDWNIKINQRHYFFTSQAVIPGMKEAGGGSIINFSSISYMMGNAGYPLYVQANAGLTGLTRGLSREFGADKIRVNALMPGWVLTQAQLDKWASEEALAAHMERMSLKEHLEPADIAGGVLFLASDISRAMTGQALVIDGGVVVTG